MKSTKKRIPKKYLKKALKAVYTNWKDGILSKRRSDMDLTKKMPCVGCDKDMKFVGAFIARSHTRTSLKCESCGFSAIVIVPIKEYEVSYKVTETDKSSRREEL